MDFRILGPLEVDREGRELPLGGRQQRALLALLLLHANEVVPVEEIIDELWPEAPPASATRSVHALVSRLRRLLEGGPAARNGDEDDHGILLTRAHGYVLRVAPDELDLHRFESLLSEGRGALAEGRPEAAARMLREALAIWRGPPLAEFASSSLGGVAVANLNERRLSALEERIEADLAAGRSSELVAELETLVASHPLRERLRGQLMIALYRAGRQAEALQVYQDARRMLVGELGIDPSQALQRLEQAILRQDESLEPPRRAVAQTPGRRRFLLAAVGILCVVALAAAALALHGDDGSSVEVLPHSVVAIDASTGRLVADVRAAGEPIALVADEHSVWVADRGGLTVSRIDRNDASKVKTFRLDATTPTSIAAGADAVWLTVRGSLIRIDPEFGALAATLDPDPLPPQYGTGAVAAGGAGVWFSGPSGTARIDPSSNRVAFVVPEAAGPSAAIAVGADAVWAAVEGEMEGQLSDSDIGTLYEIKGRGVVATTPLKRRPVGIAVGGRTAWVALHRAGLVAVDVDTAAVVANIDAAENATGVAVAGRNVWVTSADGTLRRVDAVRRVVTKTIRLGRPAVAVAAAGNRVWVAVG
jgi:DNA-binding SARP family transcriptional activator